MIPIATWKRSLPKAHPKPVEYEHEISSENLANELELVEKGWRFFAPIEGSDDGHKRAFACARWIR